MCLLLGKVSFVYIEEGPCQIPCGVLDFKRIYYMTLFGLRYCLYMYFTSFYLSNLAIAIVLFPDLLSWSQAILVVVRGHYTPQDNSEKIGRPRYKNLKIRKGKKREENSLQVYISLLQSRAAVHQHVCTHMLGLQAVTHKPYSKAITPIQQVISYSALLQYRGNSY